MIDLSTLKAQLTALRDALAAKLTAIDIALAAVETCAGLLEPASAPTANPEPPQNWPENGRPFRKPLRADPPECLNGYTPGDPINAPAPPKRRGRPPKARPPEPAAATPDPAATADPAPPAYRETRPRFDGIDSTPINPHRVGG